VCARIGRSSAVTTESANSWKERGRPPRIAGTRGEAWLQQDDVLNPAQLPTLDAVVFERYNTTAYKSIHGLNAGPNGRGATYIVLVRNENSIPALQRLFHGENAWRDDVVAIPSGARKNLSVEYRQDSSHRPEYRIQRQDTDRHPAWSRDNGFPENDPAYVDRLVLYLARTSDGLYYAGYLDVAQRAELPESLRDVVEEVMTKRPATGGWAAR
jgi:hypothetical protein